MKETRPMYWSIRRELWENRSVLIAPLAVAVFVMFGFMISTIGMAARRRVTMTLPPAQQCKTIAQPYDVAAMVLIMTAIVIAFFYCLDALQSERRDRSILFWKSLPVSDKTTVLSKASMPLVVLAYAFIVTIATQISMLIWSTLVLLPSGQGATTWTRYNLFEQSFILLYGLVALALWHAPIYGWLLLVSAWARRAAILWAFLPAFAVGALEKIAFNTTYFGTMLKYRFMGHLKSAFEFKGDRLDSISQLTPGRFLLTPGLWVGLLFAAAFLALAIRIRRYREPN